MSICRNLVVLASCFYFVAGKDSSSVPRRSRCPTPSQSNPGTWTTYHDIQRLSWCDSPMLLDFAVYNPLEDPKTHITIRATTSVANTDKLDTTLSVEPEYKKVTLQLLSLVDHPGNSVENHGEHVESAAKLVQTFWQADSNSNMNSIFATAGGTAVAVYAGSMIQKSITTSVIAKKFINYIQDKNVNGLVLLQYCGANSDHMFGIVADTSLDSLPKVQRVVRRWSDGICERDGNISDWVDEVIYVKMEPGPRQPARVNATSDVIHPSFAAKFQQEFQANGPQKPLGGASILAICSTVQVASGDSCASLATKCKVLPADFTKYNPSPTFCSSLAVGQYACCSAGNLPDLTPKPNADGSCATYTVLSGDFCAKIAAANGITLAAIESLNKNTWGWMGCANIQVGQLICISTGHAPLPAAVTSAICGPQVPGTTMPNATTTLASLHPCPLKACCNIWGQWYVVWFYLISILHAWVYKIIVSNSILSALYLPSRSI
jgi:chitinase